LTSGMKFSPLVSQAVNALEAVSADKSSIYLVGGALRDTLLGLPAHDLDFVLQRDTLQIARKVANALGGAYYTMDEEFQVGRVVLEGETEQRQVLDFAAMQGENLEQDLRKRDFTINAIAVAMDDLSQLIDPLGGVEDLLKKRLRTCSPESLLADPVRVLRAVRMTASYKLAILPETRALVEPAVARLGQISAERLRDEFLKVLDAPKPDTSLRLLDLFGVLERIIPEVAGMKGVTQSAPHIYDVWEHSLHTVQAMDQVLQLLDEAYVHENEYGGDLFSGLLSQRLGRFRQQISAHLRADLVPDRPYRPLIFLAALCHDFTKPRHRTVEESGRIRFIGHESSGAEAIAQRGTELRLSKTEIQRLVRILQDHMRPWQLAREPQPPSGRAVYRFWRDAGPAGVDIVLLALADLVGIYGHTLPQAVMQSHLDVARRLLEAYWETPEQVAPTVFLNGNEIIELFELQPGPQIGKLLEALREAQAIGAVQDRQQAITFLSETLAEL
jgi:tRNA nucleotidyltransferase/poly(A) polymerase